MNLYEKLNRLDDSLVESTKVINKKKLTESLAANEYDDDIDEMLTENTLTSCLPPSIDNMLMDMAQMCGEFDYSDVYKFVKAGVDDDTVRRLKNLYRRWHRAAEYNDEEKMCILAKEAAQIIGKYDLTENRCNPYFTPYGYKDAAKVLNGKAPEYYYHLKHIEMDKGDGIKLARYAMRKGLPVMVDKNSDPDYPEFAIKGQYHWDDYFYSYPTAHEEDLIAWDGKMFTEQSLTEEESAREKLMNTYPDDFGHWEPYTRDPETKKIDTPTTTSTKELGARQKLRNAFPDLNIPYADSDEHENRPLKEAMSRNVIEFIQDNIGLIEVEDWDAVVYAAYRSLLERELTELFDMLKLALNIDIKVTENKDGTISVTVDKKEVTPVEKPKQKVRQPEVKKEQPKVQPKPQPRQPVSKPEPKVTQPEKKDEVKDPELVARITAWDTLATKLKEFANNHKTGRGPYATPLSMYITPNKNELTATTNELNYGFRTINDLDQEVKHPLGKTTYADNKFDVDLTQLESRYQQITKQRQRTWAYKGPRK